MMIDILRKRIETTIRAAGADYVGMMDRLVLFNSRETGSTLALPASTILSGDVPTIRKYIERSNAKFKVLP